MSLNRVTIAGRLSRDLEMRHTQSGTAVASFTLAVESDYKNKQTGEKSVDWVDCVAWNSTAEFMSKYLYEKGRMVVIDGRVQTRTWGDRDGNKRKSTEIVAEHVYFGDSKRDGDSENKYEESPEYSSEFREIDDEEGDLPF